MKRSQARQHSRRRDRTPSVICLPPPQLPVAPRREPAMVASREADAAALSRQARRKALRDEAKAMRRTGAVPETAAPPEPVPTPGAEPEPALPVVAADVPLPPERALVAARPRGLALVAHRMLVWSGLRRPAPVGGMAQQLRALRDELATVQRSIDRLIEGAA